MSLQIETIMEEIADCYLSGKVIIRTTW